MSQPGIKTPKIFHPTPEPSKLDFIESRVKALETEVPKLKSDIAEITAEVSELKVIIALLKGEDNPFKDFKFTPEFFKEVRRIQEEDDPASESDDGR